MKTVGKKAQILPSWQSSREGVVMRNSLGKKRKEIVTIQEEKRRQRLKENEMGTGKLDCIILSNNISPLYHHPPRCSSLSLCMLAEQALTQASSSTFNSAQYSSWEGFWNAWHSFNSASMMTFHNHCIDGFLMLARPMRAISVIHHPEATRSEQDGHDTVILRDVLPTNYAPENLSHCNNTVTMAVLC